MLYVDTSVIVKLYVRETYSKEAAAFLKSNDEAIPLTRFHDLEFSNAVHLKGFRGELTDTEAEAIVSTFKDHEKSGIYFRPPIGWPRTFDLAVELATHHTKKIGARSLDILHVASALAVGSDRFLTLDGRQANLAVLAGLNVESIEGSD